MKKLCGFSVLLVCFGGNLLAMEATYYDRLVRDSARSRESVLAELQLKIVQQKELDELVKIRQDVGQIKANFADKNPSSPHIDELVKIRQCVDKISDNLIGKNLSWVARYPKTALVAAAVAGSAVTVGVLKGLPVLHSFMRKK